MSLLHGFPQAAAVVAATLLPFCVHRDTIVVHNHYAGTSEQTPLWYCEVPLNAEPPRAFNRVVQQILAQWQRIVESTPRDRREMAMAAPLRIERRTVVLPLWPFYGGSAETFTVPYGAIRGELPEHGQGGLDEARASDTWFYNRLCRYRD